MEDLGHADAEEGRVVTQNRVPGGSDQEVWEAIQVVRDHAVRGGWARGKPRLSEDELLLSKMPPDVKAGLVQVTAGLKKCLDPFLASPVPFVDPLKREMAAHHARRDDLTRGFVGQNTIVELVTRYCFDGNNRASPVFILEGQDPGNGLSSVMAAASLGVEKILRERSVGALFVTRFIGATVRSENVNALLHSVILQLECQLALATPEGEAAWQHHQGTPPWAAPLDKSSEWYFHQRRQQQPPADYATLCTRMQDVIQLASAKHPLILFLDAMDQLRGWLNTPQRGGGTLMVPWEGVGEGHESVNGETAAAVRQRLLAWLPFANPADPQVCHCTRSISVRNLFLFLLYGYPCADMCA